MANDEASCSMIKYFKKNLNFTEHSRVNLTTEPICFSIITTHRFFNHFYTHLKTWIIFCLASNPGSYYRTLIIFYSLFIILAISTINIVKTLCLHNSKPNYLELEINLSVFVENKQILGYNIQILKLFSTLLQAVKH